MTPQKAVRLVDGPMGSTAGLSWPVDVEWPDVLWAGRVSTPDGQDAVMLSPVMQGPAMHRYQKVRQSSLSDEVVEGVRIIRGAEYVWAPGSPEDPDLEAAGESALSPELDP